MVSLDFPYAVVGGIGYVEFAQGADRYSARAVELGDCRASAVRETLNAGSRKSRPARCDGHPDNLVGASVGDVQHVAGHPEQVVWLIEGAVNQGGLAAGGDLPHGIVYLVGNVQQACCSADSYSVGEAQA